MALNRGNGPGKTSEVQRVTDPTGAPPVSLGVILPTWNAAGTLSYILASLRTGHSGIDLDIVVVDGGSGDGTPALACNSGTRVITAPRGRGSQLGAGAAAVAGEWLLFLHADTVLESGWEEAVIAFTRDRARNAARAGYFRFGIDDRSPMARRLEALVAWRCRRLGLPYGDQGLLIARAFYTALGGFRPLPLMEDVDLVRRIGRRRLVLLPVAARSSAVRYRRDGYLARSARNLFCLGLYFLGVPPRLIARLYG